MSARRYHLSDIDEVGPRERAEAAARRSGLSLGEWLDAVVEDVDAERSERRRPERRAGGRRGPAYDRREISQLFELVESLAERVSDAQEEARAARDLAEEQISAAAPRQRRGDLAAVDRRLEAAQADLFAAEDGARKALREARQRARTLGEGDDHDRLNVVTSAIGALEQRIDEMMRRLDESRTAPAPQPAQAAPARPADEDLLAAIRARLDALSQRIDAPQEAQADPRIETTLRALEDRLADISVRLDAPQQSAPTPDPAIESTLRALEDRLANISVRLDAPQPPPIVQVVEDAASDERLARIETQLKDLAERLAQPPPAPAAAPVPQAPPEPQRAAGPALETRPATFHDQLEWDRDTAAGDADLAEAVRQISARQKVLERQFEPEAFGRVINERFQELGEDIAQRVEAASSERSIAQLQDQVRALADQLAASRSNVVDTEHLISLQRQLVSLHRTLETAVSQTSLAAVVDEVRKLGEKFEALRRDGMGGPELGRIEADMRAIRNAVAEAAPREAFTALEARIGELARRLDSRAGPLDEETFRRLSAQIDALSTLVADAMPADALQVVISEMRALDAKIEGLKSPGDAAAIEGLRREIVDLRAQIRSAEPGMVADLAQRIDRLQSTVAETPALTERLAADIRDQIQLSATDAPALAERLAADIRARLGERGHDVDPAVVADLARRIDQLQSAVAETPALTERLAADIRAQIGEAARELAPRASVDLEAIEGQIRALAAKIDTARSGDAGAAQVAAMEGQIARLTEALAEAARDAAQDAVRSALANGAPRAGHEEEAIRALRENLAELRILTDASDRRSQETLLAVHDTLRKVVDRLASLENARPAVDSEPQLPRVSPEEPLAPRASEPQPAREQRSPVEAAREAAARAAQLKADASERLDADLPLEPGSGRPKRPMTASEAVRAAREQIKAEVNPPQQEASVRSSFIAAVRRATRAGRSAAPPQSEAPAAQAKPARSMRVPPKAAGAAPSEPPEKATFVAPGEAAETKPGFLARFAAPVPPQRRRLVMIVAAIVIVLGALQVLRSGAGGGSDGPTEPPAQTVAEVPAGPAPAPEATPGFTPPNAAPREQTTFQPPPAAPAERNGPAPAVNLPPIPAAITQPRLRSALEAGDARALYEVGSRLADGNGVERDLSAAIPWFRLGAERDHAPSLYRLANMLEKGHGTARDVRQAMTLYQRAADLGNRKAMHNLAALYASGADGRADYARAFPLFQRAAELGLVDSQYNLAVLYVNGLGTERNLGEAYTWFSIAAQNGDREAERKRDELVARLDGQAMMSARLAAQSFRARAIDPAANEEVIPASRWEDQGERTSRPAPNSNLGISVGATAPPRT